MLILKDDKGQFCIGNKAVFLNVCAGPEVAERVKCEGGVGSKWLLCLASTLVELGLGFGYRVEV